MKIKNTLLNQLNIIFYLIIFAITPSAIASSANCPPIEYGATKKAAAAFLKAKYGEAYNAFDLDHPSLVNLDSGDEKPKFPPGTVSSVGFGVYATQHIFKPYTAVVIEFERCTNKIVDSFELHGSPVTSK